MTGVVKIVDETTGVEQYRIFCQDCGHEYVSFDSDHYCPERRERVAA